MKKLSIKDRAMVAVTTPQISTQAPSPIPVPAVEKPKTGPGSMMSFMSKESAVMSENTKLKANLAEFDNASPTRRIDPQLIVRSKWANRLEQSFTDSEFAKLKEEIDSAGGNVQPIKVRRLAGEGGQFEIVFGHRRHQACLELGIPVLAMVGDVNEQELFIEMDRENRQRKDLRPYEQGLMYKRALDEGLFPSARKLAESAGVDLTNLGKALALARLPVEVISAFESPLDLQVRWGPELTKALETNPDQVITVAKAIRNESPRPSSKQVLDRLTRGGSTVLPPTSKKIEVKGAGGQSGSIQLDTKDKSIVVALKNVDPIRLDELKKLIQSFLS